MSTKKKDGDLPYVCPDHPDALVRHEWLRTRARSPFPPYAFLWDEDHDHRYFCSECGRELAPEEGDEKETVVRSGATARFSSGRRGD